METRIRVWKEFGGGRKRGSGKPEAKIIIRNNIQAVLVYKAAPYEIQRHIQTYRPTSCSTQNYLFNMQFSNRLRSLLFNLRCKSVKNIKDNFHRKYKENLFCPFSCENIIDSQEHLLVCPGIKKHLNIEHLEVMNRVRYEHLFGEPLEQYEAVKAFHTILKVRDRLLDKTRRPAYHGNNSGPLG